MAGLPGSGKSTLALAVGQRVGWPVLDKDTIKSGLLELGAEEDLAAKASYTLLHELAQDLVDSQGQSVILDTPSSYESVFETCSQIAEDAGANLRIVLCEASIETRAHRLATRKRRPSHVVAIDEEAEAAIQRVFDQLPQEVFRVSTEGPADEIVDEVVLFAMSQEP
jgi:predicted kinase